MNDKDNYLQIAELSTEQNANMIDGILGNNTALPLPPSIPVRRKSRRTRYGSIPRAGGAGNGRSGEPGAQPRHFPTHLVEPGGA